MFYSNLIIKMCNRGLISIREKPSDSITGEISIG